MTKYIDKYKLHSQPPKDALKKIEKGTRINGMTDINPQWRLEALTNAYGLCGFGWYYSIVEKEYKSSGDIVALFVTIALFVKMDDEWSKPIIGTGGSKLVAKESSGLYLSDEALKMATTDAISVCCKQLGIGSDIYRGFFDGSKYRDEKPEQNKQQEPTQEQKNANFFKALKAIDPTFSKVKELLASDGLTDYLDVQNRQLFVENLKQEMKK